MDDLFIPILNAGTYPNLADPLYAVNSVTIGIKPVDQAGQAGYLPSADYVSLKSMNALFSSGYTVFSMPTINGPSATMNLGTNNTPTTINIGTGAQAKTINIGSAGDTIVIQGAAIYEQGTQTVYTDPLLTLNKNGTSATGSGLEYWSGGMGGSVQGYFKVADVVGTSDGFAFKANGSAYSATLSHASLTANRIFTYPDAAGTFALTTNPSKFDIAFTGSGAPTLLGKYLSISASTFTDTSTTTGNHASFAFNAMAAPVLAAANAGVIFDTASTLYIAGGPTSGANTPTITNSYGIYNAGNNRVDGLALFNNATAVVSAAVNAVNIAGGLYIGAGILVVGNTIGFTRNIAGVNIATAGVAVSGAFVTTHTGTLSAGAGFNGTTVTPIGALTNQSYVQHNGTGTLPNSFDTTHNGGIASMYSPVWISNSGTVGGAQGALSLAILSSTGTIDKFAAFRSGTSVNLNGSTAKITTNVGFWAEDQTIYDTSSGLAAGFYGLVTIGSKKYNLNMTGTAPNFLGAPIGIGRDPNAVSWVQIGVGSNTVAAMNFLQATGLPSAVAGNVEFYNSFYVTNAVGIRGTLPLRLTAYYNVVNPAAADGTLYTLYSSSFTNLLSINGDIIRFSYSISVTTSVQGKIFQVSYGGVNITFTALTTVTGTALIEGYFIRDANGTVKGHGIMNGSSVTFIMSITAGGSVTHSASNAITLSASVAVGAAPSVVAANSGSIEYDPIA